MLNIDLVYNLYEGLTPDKKEELLGLLFKKSRQTMAYFKRSKDISLSKLEILADFYHMPLDYFQKIALSIHYHEHPLHLNGHCVC